MKTVQQLKTAIDLNDNVPELHLALGRNYLAIEEYDQAVFEFAKAYSLSPADPLPNLYLRVYARIGELQRQFSMQNRR